MGLTGRLPKNLTHVYSQYTIEVEFREKVQANLMAHNISFAIHYPLLISK